MQEDITAEVFGYGKFVVTHWQPKRPRFGRGLSSAQLGITVLEDAKSIPKMVGPKREDVPGWDWPNPERVSPFVRMCL